MSTAIASEKRIDRKAGIRIWEDWTRLWNGAYELSPELVGNSFDLFLTAAVNDDPARITNESEVAAWIAEVRSKFTRIQYSTVAGPFVDPEAQVVTCGWDAHGVFAGRTGAPGDEPGKPFHINGTDILTIRDGKIVGCRTMSNPARP